MRIVAWNIRGGGGERAARIARQIERWAPDVVVLSEFRATPPSCAVAAALAARLPHQLTSTTRSSPGTNALLVAARWPLRPLRLRAGPMEPCRWLAVRVAAPSPLVVGGMHIPNRISGRKYPYFDAVLACAQRWAHGPALLVGDTNSGRRGLDEEVPAFNVQEEGWIDGLAACGWTDAYRHLYADARAYTWFSPNGRHGFRIDQAFLNAPLLARLKDVAYLWGGAARQRRRAWLSDHAALLVDLADP
jgi:exonuclease III